MQFCALFINNGGLEMTMHPLVVCFGSLHPLLPGDRELFGGAL